MNDKDLKKAFEIMNPTPQQKEEMWQKIVAHSTQEVKLKKKRIAPILLVAVLMVVTVFASVIGYSAITGGSFYQSIKNILTPEENKQDIINQVADDAMYNNDIYAPDISYIDKKIMIFSTRRGLIIYDLQKDKVKSTIDLQKIECNYFGCDSKQTCIVKDKDRLIIFNANSNYYKTKYTPYGTYYIYDINSNRAEIEYFKLGTDKDILGEYFEKWEKNQEKYSDIYNTFDYDNLYDDYDTNSENSVKWHNKGKYYISFIGVSANNYYLVNYDCQTDKIKEKSLNIPRSKKDKSDVLPKFRYTGEDKAVKAICEYMQNDEEFNWEIDDKFVWIPAFEIYDKIEENGELLVYGTFASNSYIKNGNIIESCSGSAIPDCIHLVEDKDGYKVKNADMAGDGEDYPKDIERITEGHPIIRFQLYNWEYSEETTLDYIRMYVLDSGLDIKYYRDFGGDLIELFPD